MPILRGFFACMLTIIVPLNAQDARDAFATPEALGQVADGFLDDGNYAGASVEAEETVLYPVSWREGDSGVKQSIWFTFRVPTDGIWKLTVGHPSDWAPVAPSYPVVFEEADLASAQPLFPLDNNPGVAKCLLKSGTTYRLGLRCFSSERSFFEIRFHHLAPPANDSAANSTAMTGNSAVIDPQGATLEPGESTQSGNMLGSAWVRWRAPADGKWLIEIPTIRVVFPFFPAPAPLFDFPSRDFSADVSWIPSESSRFVSIRPFELFSAASVAAPAAVLAQGSSWILFEAVAGRDYWIAGYDRWWDGDTKIPIHLEPASPNDLREHADDLGSGSALSRTGHFLGAGISSGEELPADFAVSRTIWFKWAARATGPVDLLIEGLGSPTASQVAVQVFSQSAKTGGAVAGSYGREWHFDAAAGETYHFQISAADDPNAAFQLRLLASEPADSFSQAVELHEVALASTVGSTLQIGEPAAEADEGSIWLKWHSESRQVVSISLQSLQAIGHWHWHDARMELFTGASPDALAQACEQTFPNWVVFVADAGKTYHIRVLATPAADGVAKVTVAKQSTGSGFTQLMSEAGALLVTAPIEGRNAQALALVNQALALEPQDARALLAAAYLELRIATETPTGRVMAARISPAVTNLLPLSFISSAVGPEGEIPAGLSFADFLDDFDAETWPHIASALERLAAISDPAFTYSHPTLPVYPRGKAGGPGTVTDAHDRRTIAAMIMTLRGALNYLASLDGPLPARDFFGWLCDGSPTLQELLAAHPEFLTFGPSDSRFSAWLWFSAASAQEQLAKDLYHAPFLSNFDDSLFTAADQNKLDRWFAWVASANGPTEPAWDGRVNLSRWLFGTTSPRSLLPVVEANQLRAYSAPNVTFDGLLPDSTTVTLHRAWAKRGWLADHETLDSWLTRNFPTNPPDPSDDPDGDGISLLLEYAFGLSPKAPDAAPYRPDLRRVALPDGTSRTEIGFRRRVAMDDSEYRAFQSGDLKTWEILPVPDDAEADTMSGFERVTVRVPDGPVPADRAFFRLQFLPPPSGSGSTGVVSGN